MKIFLLILLLIILLPLPIIIKADYRNKKINIKLYKFTVLDFDFSLDNITDEIKHFEESKKKEKKDDDKKNTDKSPSNKKEKNDTAEKKEKPKPLLNIDYNFIMGCIEKLQNMWFKPTFRLTCSFSYSLADAARTALCYGALSSFPGIIYYLFKIPFKIKKFKVNVLPVFEDKFLLKFNFKSIFFVSLANIIYMIIVFSIYLAWQILQDFFDKNSPAHA